MMNYRGFELEYSKQGNINGYEIQLDEDNTVFCRSMSDAMIVIDEYVNEIESVMEHDYNLEPIEDVYYNGEVLGLPVEKWNELSAQGYSQAELEELDNKILTEQIKRVNKTVQGVA